MRKGELIKEDIKRLKAGDRAFDTSTKQFFVVTTIEDDAINGKLLSGGPCRIQKDSVICQLKIMDTVTREEFILNAEQQAYVYKSGRGDNVSFFTRDNQLLMETQAIVAAKNVEMQGVVNYIEPIVNAYGKYVASQKANKEPAKNFKDWFFDISI
jgi:hypothetical protein